ncbi:MAG: single-stranded-DNA-specific exonuclease RecJ [Myxococcota bacterium]
MQRRWQQRPLVGDPTALSRELGIPALLATHLCLRGLTDPGEAERFLDPRLGHMLDPKLMAGMDKAVERLVRAVRNKERVALYGDYDVDGVTSTTLMTLVLRRFGLDPIQHIPHRIRDGYGLNHNAVRLLKERGASLIVTLDCGVTAVEEVKAAVDLGVDVIVVDHHTVPVTLPPAVAVLNPHRPDCAFPFKQLCAVGVAFYVCVALRTALRAAGLAGPDGGPDLRDYLDLVALGTVADLVPLRGENRMLVAHGLRILAQARRHGIAALLDVSRIRREDVDAGSVAFQLGPRINAAGRLQDAMVGVQCLLAEDRLTADRLATQLDAENRARRAEQQRVIDEALTRVADEPIHHDARALVLYDEGWHPGVVGIAAQKMVEQFHRPSVLIGAGGIGSGRSIEAFHLHQALAKTGEHLRGFGGHAHAAGLRIAAQNVDAFRRALYQHASEVLKPEDLTPAAHHDGPLSAEHLTDDTVDTLQRAAPFGRGNAEPCFLLTGLPVAQTRVVGKDHLQLEFTRNLRGIAFRMAERAEELRGPVEFLATPEHNTWRGVRRLNVRVRDFRPVGVPA